MRPDRTRNSTVSSIPTTWTLDASRETLSFSSSRPRPLLASRAASSASSLRPPAAVPVSTTSTRRSSTIRAATRAALLMAVTPEASLRQSTGPGAASNAAA